MVTVSLEKQENGPETVGETSRKQPAGTIKSSIKAIVCQGCKKLLRTAWNLACTPSMQHSYFTILPVRKWYLFN